MPALQSVRVIPYPACGQDGLALNVLNGALVWAEA